MFVEKISLKEIFVDLAKKNLDFRQHAGIVSYKFDRENSYEVAIANYIIAIHT